MMVKHSPKNIKDGKHQNYQKLAGGIIARAVNTDSPKAKCE